MPPGEVILLLATAAVFVRMAFGLNDSDLEYLGVDRNDD